MSAALTNSVFLGRKECNALIGFLLGFPNEVLQDVQLSVLFFCSISPVAPNCNVAVSAESSVSTGIP